MQRQRSIVHEPEFIDELGVFVGHAEKALDFIAGAEYLLSREPESGVPDGEGLVWFLSLPPIGDRQLTIYYTFDLETVTFLAIRPV